MGLQTSLLASCILAKSKSKEGSESEATNEVEVSGSITDEEPIEFVKASDSVSISGVNLIAAVSYDVTAYSVDAAGVKTVIFSGSFAEPKFQFKSNVPKRYILLEIIRQPDGGKYGAVLPPPTSGKKASMVVDGTTTIAAKLAEAVTEKAASGDFNSRKALADGNISVADLLMVSQSVRRTVVEQKEQNKGSSIDLSVLATNLVIKSNDFVSRLYAEGQTPADVSQKISEATYQTVFGEYATIAAPGILAYRTRPDLGTSEASQINVAYEAIKLSPSESMITVDQAFRVEATTYRTASSVTAAVAAQSQVTSTFKTVFESCVQTPSSCSGTSYTPPPAPTSQTSGPTPSVPATAPPSAPRDLEGVFLQQTSEEVAAEKGRVSLSWVAPDSPGSSSVVDYIIEYKASGDSSWVTYLDGVSLNTAVVVSDMQSGMAYDFRVKAKNSTKLGQASNQLSVVFPRKLYFKNSSDRDNSDGFYRWRWLDNWYLTSDHTVRAKRLPSSYDDVYLYHDIPQDYSGNPAPLVRNLTVSNEFIVGTESCSEPEFCTWDYPNLILDMSVGVSGLASFIWFPRKPVNDNPNGALINSSGGAVGQEEFSTITGNALFQGMGAFQYGTVTGTVTCVDTKVTTLSSACRPQ